MASPERMEPTRMLFPAGTKLWPPMDEDEHDDISPAYHNQNGDTGDYGNTQPSSSSNDPNAWRYAPSEPGSEGCLDKLQAVKYCMCPTMSFSLHPMVPAFIIFASRLVHHFVYFALSNRAPLGDRRPGDEVKPIIAGVIFVLDPFLSLFAVWYLSVSAHAGAGTAGTIGNGRGRRRVLGLMMVSLLVA